MVGIAAAHGARSVLIAGHGLTISGAFELRTGITVLPTWPMPEYEKLSKTVKSFREYAIIVSGAEIASFSIRVSDERSEKHLAAKAWNALWTFHLLSLACNAPCFSLYSYSIGDNPVFVPSNRNVVQPVTALKSATNEQLEWAKRHATAFDHLIASREFSTAIRCLSNAHYLPDVEASIMLLWSGIEGLFGVDGELSRRIALYSAILLDGEAVEKASFFEAVKRAYNIRSRVVHGSRLSGEIMKAGLCEARRILTALLTRCVALGRVPRASELDKIAASQSVHM